MDLSKAFFENGQRLFYLLYRLVDNEALSNLDFERAFAPSLTEKDIYNFARSHELKVTPLSNEEGYYLVTFKDDNVDEILKVLKNPYVFEHLLSIVDAGDKFLIMYYNLEIDNGEVIEVGKN